MSINPEIDNADWPDYEGPERRRPRRDENGGGDKWLDGLPQWAKTFVVLLRTVVAVGIQNSLIIILVVFVIWLAAKGLPDIRIQMTALAEAVKDDIRTRDQQTVILEKIYQMERRRERRECLKDATTDNAREACLQE